MGPLVDLTLGRCSSSNGYYRSGGSSSYPSDHMETLREAAQEYLSTLKEERKKIEGFKRELPLCIELLDDAITTAEEKLLHGRDDVLPVGLRLSCSAKENAIRPTLEESMPLKGRERDPASEISSDGERESYCETKKLLPPPPPTQPAWMASWNRTTSQSTEVVTEMVRDPEHSEQEQSSGTSSQQQRPAGAGAFVPFQLRELQQPLSSNSMPVVSRPTPRSGGFCADLNLCAHSERPAITSPSGIHTSPTAASDVEVGSIQGTPAAPLLQTPDAGNQSSGGGGNSLTSNRKARRCWSPELHRRFVEALHQLGGAHIATPKQLRELMKVDGLTNDEVKSHLQKYRLHTRRPGSSSGPHESAGQAPTSQLVVVGGIWMPPHHHASAVSPAAAAAAAVAASQPGSHSGVANPSQSPQFCHPTSLPLDYFAACINNGSPAGPPVQMLMHRQPIFESPSQAGTCQSQSSPQGPLQVTSQLSGATQGSSSETCESGEEEAKSQSTSWKVCRRSGQQPEAENQSMTVESSQRSEPEPKKLKILKMHELDTAAASGNAAAHASTTVLEGTLEGSN